MEDVECFVVKKDYYDLDVIVYRQTGRLGRIIAAYTENDTYLVPIYDPAGNIDHWIDI